MPTKHAINVANGTKLCPACGETKPLDDFYRLKSGYYYSSCKPCHYLTTQAWRAANRLKIRQMDRARYPQERDRKRALKRMAKYGITPDEYDALMERQNHQCPICLRPFTGLSGVGKHNSVNWLGESVDHDHETGAVRGILHRRCNLALEFMLSEAEAQRARAYLRGHSHARRSA